MRLAAIIAATTILLGGQSVAGPDYSTYLFSDLAKMRGICGSHLLPSGRGWQSGYEGCAAVEAEIVRRMRGGPAAAFAAEKTAIPEHEIWLRKMMGK